MFRIVAKLFPMLHFHLLENINSLFGNMMTCDEQKKAIPLPRIQNNFVSLHTARRIEN